MATNSDSHMRIFAYADWIGLEKPTLMGALEVYRFLGKETFSFTYDKDWLKEQSHIFIDPDIRNSAEKQFAHFAKANFGFFLDSSPDQWGRLLMKRREASFAKAEKRTERNLLASDFLLGVYDKHRMGGIRFKLDVNGAFLSDITQFTIPHWSNLNELEEVSLKFQKNEILEPTDNWIANMLYPGASLGGARPKASILDNEDNLWIAKFPSYDDKYDVGSWEFIVTQLAINAGIRVPKVQVRKFTGKHHTFLSKRFDRMKRQRVHFASAMTLIGCSQSSGNSYLKICDFIKSNSPEVSKDLEELWRRIVFNICISNTDDHFRNHGFLLNDKKLF